MLIYQAIPLTQLMISLQNFPHSTSFTQFVNTPTSLHPTSSNSSTNDLYLISLFHQQHLFWSHKFLSPARIKFLIVFCLANLHESISGTKNIREDLIKAATWKTCFFSTTNFGIFSFHGPWSECRRFQGTRKTTIAFNLNDFVHVVAQKPLHCHIPPVNRLQICYTAFKVFYYQQHSHLAEILPKYTLSSQPLSSAASTTISEPLMKTLMVFSNNFPHQLHPTFGSNCLVIFHLVLTLPAFRRHLKHHQFFWWFCHFVFVHKVC